MNIAYSLKLECSQCKAEVILSGSDTRDDMYVARKLGIRYQQGQPKPKIKWRIDGTITKKLTTARKFVLDNPEVTGSFGTFLDVNWSIPLPEYVGVQHSLNFVNPPRASTFVMPTEYRFVDCPACGGRVYMNSKAREPECQ